MKKLIVTFFALLLCFAATLTSCKKANNTPTAKENLPKFPIILDTAYDLDNLEGCIGIADYVFVAHVIEATNTVYSNNDVPYTWYKVENLKNIKGKLKLGELPVLNMGGVSKDGTYYEFLEGGPNLDAGKTYILAIDGMKDTSSFGAGTLLADTAWPIDLTENTSGEEAIEQHPTFLKFVEAYKNEIPDQRKRFKSIYDESYEEQESQ